jgi:hypothetical protein
MELDGLNALHSHNTENTTRTEIDSILTGPSGQKFKAGETLTGHSSIRLHSRIRGGMLKCRLPVGQPLRWNGQMEGIYTSVSSALIGERA